MNPRIHREDESGGSFHIIHVLKCVKSLDIARVLRICDDLFCMKDLRIFINDLILDDRILRDRDLGADDGILDHSAWFNRYAAADDAVLDCSGDDGTVGDQGLLDGSTLDILCRAGIICPCVDRPLCCEEAGSCLVVCELKVCIIVGLEVCDRFEVALVLYSLDIELFRSSLVAYNVEQVVHGGFLLCLIDKVKEESLLHDVAVHENVLGLLAADVRLDRLDALLVVELKILAVHVSDVRIVDFVIKESNIIACLDMRCKESFIILREYHIGRNDDHIISFYAIDDILVVKEGSDICVIDLVDFTLRGEKRYLCYRSR